MEPPELLSVKGTKKEKFVPGSKAEAGAGRPGKGIGYILYMGWDLYIIGDRKGTLSVQGKEKGCWLETIVE